MRSKKGVEMSMNLIIIAAISLLILVILAVLVLRGESNNGNQSSVTVANETVKLQYTQVCNNQWLMDNQLLFKDFSCTQIMTTNKGNVKFCTATNVTLNDNWDMERQPLNATCIEVLK